MASGPLKNQHARELEKEAPSRGAADAHEARTPVWQIPAVGRGQCGDVESQLRVGVERSAWAISACTFGRLANVYQPSGVDTSNAATMSCPVGRRRLPGVGLLGHSGSVADGKNALSIVAGQCPANSAKPTLAQLKVLLLSERPDWGCAQERAGEFQL